jgi:phospholipase C
VSGAGHGAVTSNPGGINCSSGTCSANFSPGAQVTLTGTPGANYSFSGWTGCSGGFSCSFILSSAETITAKFGSSNPYAALNHIILFAQENRSFDHYFGYMRQYWANHGIPDQPFDGLPQFTPAAQCTFNNGINSCAAPSIPGCNLADDMEECKPDGTNPIASFHLASVCQENQSPFWNEAHNDWDFADPTGSSPADLQNPALDGFVWTAAYDARSNNFMDLNGVRAMGYFNDTDLNYYYFMATQFGTSDRWFSPVMSRTELNRMYMIAATSQGYAYPISSNPQDATVLSAKTIFEALQAAGISWRIYVDTVGTSCGGMTQPQLGGCLATYNSYINMFQYGATVASNPSLAVNVVPVTQFASDAASNSLPQFALIEPASNAGLDEHPSDSDEYPSNVQLGAQYAAEQIINPLMQSVSWGDSALIFAYDEAGGFYDHVPPEPAAAPGNTSQDPAYPIDLESSLNDICSGPGQIGTGMCDFSWTGYRVPLIVISPYSLKNYVSHNVRDTTAVLKMVEQRFGLAPLTNRDAAQLDLTEFFDFVNKPWATPPTPPVQTVYPQTGMPPACSLVPAANWVEPPAS